MGIMVLKKDKILGLISCLVSQNFWFHKEVIFFFFNLGASLRIYLK